MFKLFFSKNHFGISEMVSLFIGRNVAKLLRQYFPKLQMELSITANRRGAVFDVPLDDLYGYTENGISFSQ